MMTEFQDVPFEQWPAKIRCQVTAISMNADGKVNSFITKHHYAYRKHEFLNGAFTGKSHFVVERR